MSLLVRVIDGVEASWDVRNGCSAHYSLSSVKAKEVWSLDVAYQQQVWARLSQNLSVEL